MLETTSQLEKRDALLTARVDDLEQAVAQSLLEKEIDTERFEALMSKFTQN